MEPAGELPQLLERGRELLRRGFQEPLRSGGLVVELRQSKPERERERHEPLLGAVVEVPLEIAPGRVAGLHDARAQAVSCHAPRRSRARGDESGELAETLCGLGREPVRRPDRDGGGAPELRRRRRSAPRPATRRPSTSSSPGSRAARLRSPRGRAARSGWRTRSIAPPWNGSRAPTSTAWRSPSPQPPTMTDSSLPLT